MVFLCLGSCIKSWYLGSPSVRVKYCTVLDIFFDSRISVLEFWFSMSVSRVCIVLIYSLCLWLGLSQIVCSPILYSMFCILSFQSEWDSCECL